jgi:hypothetical protein
VAVADLPYPLRREGLYFAAVQGEGVIMDLAQNRYVALGRVSTLLWDALQEQRRPDLLQADTIRDAAGTDVDVPTLTARQLEAWRHAGLLSTPGADGLPGTASMPICRAREHETLESVDWTRMWRSRLSPRMLGRLMLSDWLVKRSLKKHGLCSTLRSMQQVAVAASDAQPGLEDRLHLALRAYFSFRRLRDQGRDDCLARSLALARALRRLRIDATVCFGVRKFPFLAHAWVEVGNRVVNERVDTIRGYALLARF